MRRPTFSARYTAAMADCGGRCPIEACVQGRLADHECRHGRLPYDRTPACGCWPQEGAAVMILPAPRVAGTSSREGRVGHMPPGSVLFHTRVGGRGTLRAVGLFLPPWSIQHVR